MTSPAPSTPAVFTPASPAGDEDALRAALARIVGPDAVIPRGQGLDFLSRDIFFDAPPAALVVRPRSTAEAAAAVRCVTDAGFAIFPRGGGVSYTRGYTPGRERSVLFDLGALDGVVEVNASDMYVTAQAGCTWKTLYDTLRPLGLRLPNFGTMSGHNATVGGGLSQGSLFYGSTRYGVSADMTLGLEVVLADGRVLATGQGASRRPGGEAAKPFYRYYGPDLTGPFLGDCGALGLKVAATFRLIPWPAAVETASFAFETFEAVWRFQNAVGRAGLAAECYSFDAVAQHQLMERSSLLQDMAALGKVVTGAGGGVLGGLRDALKIAAGGKGFMKGAAFTSHVVAEGRHKAAVDADLAEVRRLAQDGGREISNSVPAVARAQPFNSMDMILGPAGERWVPVHGYVALSEGLAAYGLVRGVLEDNADAMGDHGVIAGILSNPVFGNAMIIEVLFYWRDAPTSLHEQLVSPAKLAEGRRFAADPATHELVNRLREAIAAAFAKVGAAHFGVGRTLPYRAHRHPQTYAVLEGLKAMLDPKGLMNPGVIGLA